MSSGGVRRSFDADLAPVRALRGLDMAGPVAGLEDVAFIPQSGQVWAVDDADTATLIWRWDGVAWH
ncbi:MAG TPA: hypothetical protein VJT16_02430 [Streptosporangiaceae bacterium]|nr:hypothetical protein [Streptosporangiaceae bacterium]